MSPIDRGLSVLKRDWADLTNQKSVPTEFRAISCSSGSGLIWGAESCRGRSQAQCTACCANGRELSHDGLALAMLNHRVRSWLFSVPQSFLLPASPLVLDDTTYFFASPGRRANKCVACPLSLLHDVRFTLLASAIDTKRGYTKDAVSSLRITSLSAPGGPANL